MKSKVKDFIKNRKTTILTGLGIAAGIAIGAYGANKFIDIRKMSNGCNTILPYDDTIVDILVDARAKHPGAHNTFGGWFDNPLSINDLGAVGELLKSDGYDGDATFTHFVCIGKSNK